MIKTEIKPPGKFSFSWFRELNRYKGLIYILAWRDFKVRYSQTYLGFFWALINPIVSVSVLTFIFGVVANVDSEGIPHVLFTISGLAAWTYFSNISSEVGESIIGAQQMIKKLYFPRLVIPLSKSLIGLIDLGITISLLIILLIYYGHWPSKNIVYLPFFIFLAIIAGLSAGIWISALTVRYRDFRFVIPFIIRIGMFATPIAYSINDIPEKFHILFYLNPMVGIVEGFRWSILGFGEFSQGLMFSSLLMIFLFFSGLFYFYNVEKIISDVI